MENKPRSRGKHDAEEAIENKGDGDSLVEKELGLEGSGDGEKSKPRPMFDGVEEAEADRYEAEKALGGDAVEDPHVPGTPGPMPARPAPANPDAELENQDPKDDK